MLDRGSRIPCGGLNEDSRGFVARSLANILHFRGGGVAWGSLRTRRLSISDVECTKTGASAFRSSSLMQYRCQDV
jgi:hypothetical protein